MGDGYQPVYNSNIWGQNLNLLHLQQVDEFSETMDTHQHNQLIIQCLDTIAKVWNIINALKAHIKRDMYNNDSKNARVLVLSSPLAMVQLQWQTDCMCQSKVDIWSMFKHLKADFEEREKRYFYAKSFRYLILLN